MRIIHHRCISISCLSLCELKCVMTHQGYLLSSNLNRARFGGVLFFLEEAFFWNIGRRTGDEYVELSRRSRLLPNASVSLHSSLIFPEPQAHIDCKNLVTVCLFGRFKSHGKYFVIEGNHLFLLILRYCLARILFTCICLLKIGYNCLIPFVWLYPCFKVNGRDETWFQFPYF